MRDLPYLVIAAFLLLWGIVTAARAPVIEHVDPVATSPSLTGVQPLPPDVAELPEPVPPGFPWPTYLIYPGWTIGTLQTASGHTICSTTDDFPTVKQWYWQHLPQAVVAEMQPGEHVIVANEEIHIELRTIPGGTSIRIEPRDPRDAAR